MKHRAVYLAGVAVIALMVGIPQKIFVSPAIAQVNVGVSVTVGTLRERVAPQGEFVKVATIGEVWKPRGVPQGWQPYTRGNWIYNDKVGWYFNSDEPFAEVTYHYGRWYEDQEQGWVWVADTKWAPAWVEWRRNKQYVGWRPLPPENAPRRVGRRGGTTTTVTVTRSGGVDFVEEEWVFIPANRIVGTRIDTVMIRREQVVEIYSQTEVVGSVEQRGGIYVNLALQPAVLQRDANITIQSSNLPQAQAVPVPAQVQQISTESRAAVSAPLATTPAGAAAPAVVTAPATSPQAPAAASAPATNSPTSATAPAAPAQNPTATAAPATPATSPTTPKAPAAATGPVAPSVAKPSNSATAPAATQTPAASATPGKPATSATAPTAPTAPSNARPATATTAPPAAAKPPTSAAAPPTPPESAKSPVAGPVAPKPPTSAAAPAATTGAQPQSRPQDTKKIEKNETEKKLPATNESDKKDK